MDQLEELAPIKFAQVPNEAVDTLPDLNSIGLLTTLLRHAPGYRFTVGDVIKRKKQIPGPKLGETVAYGAMTTLITHGWAARVKFKCDGGHFHTSIFRTAERFGLADLRTIAAMFTEGTEKILYCKGCSDDPEIPVRTTIRAGATLQGPWGEYEPIADLLAPGGRLAQSPVPGNPGTGTTSEKDASSQVAPVPGFRGTGVRGTRNPGTFNKTRGEHESSSSSGVTPDTPPAADPPEEEEDPSQPKSGKHRRPRGASATQAVAERTGATAAEAEAVVQALEDRARRKGAPIGAMARYVDGIGDEDLHRHLAAVRRTAAPPVPEQRAEAVRCTLHNRALPCRMCVQELAIDPEQGRRELEAELEREGAQARPDLAELLNRSEVAV